MRKSGKLAAWCASAVRPAAALLALALMAAVATALWHPKRPSLPYLDPQNNTTAAAPQLTLTEIRNDARFAQTLWLDARPTEAYTLGHVPGAVRLTEPEWETLLPNVLELWQPENPVVVYCSSANCGASQSVADRLSRELGSANIYVLRGGWEAWHP